VPLYEYRCVYCRGITKLFRPVERREEGAVCEHCEGPAGVIFSPPAVWHPTASDRFGATWGDDLRHEGAERTGDYIRRKRAERTREERERA
jgi:putative FmdB family regulatory protein